MATAAQLLDGEAFNQLVLEKDLRTWEQDGYIYAGYHGVNGWELYKSRANPIGWLYQARRVATQANAAGGAIVLDMTIPTGTVARLITCYIANSGTNSVNLRTLDEDLATDAIILTIASAAATIGNAPQCNMSVGSATQIDSHGLMIGPGQILSAFQAGAGAQNDTMTVGVVLLMSEPVEPTWSKARSTNEANVTLAASTISTANTLQAVYLWPL